MGRETPIERKCNAISKVCKFFNANPDERDNFYRKNKINPYWGESFDKQLLEPCKLAYLNAGGSEDIDLEIPSKIFYHLYLNNFKEASYEWLFIEDGCKELNMKISTEKAIEVFYTTLEGFELIEKK